MCGFPIALALMAMIILAIQSVKGRKAVLKEVLREATT